MDKLHIVSIVGARPNFVKLAALSPELRRVANETIIHTGQHYDYKMSKIFFDEMGIPVPDSHLEIVEITHGRQTGKMLMAIESILISDQPDAVVIFGDTNSTFAGALAASKLHIPIVHIESGVRSFDRKMPEELNRIMIDHISDMLFCPTWNAACNIAIEGISKTRSYMCGDVMVDLLERQPVKLLQPVVYDNYYLLTIHREENNDPYKLKSIFTGLSGLTEDIIFPCHPKIRKYIESFDLQKNIHVINPVGYFEMRELEKHAIRIITDSGGVQKEAYLLKVPCITLRENTEWIETLIGNWNILTGYKSNDIYNAFTIDPDLDAYDPIVFGESGVCKRVSNKIVEVLYG